MHNNFRELGAPQFTAEEQKLAKKIQRELGTPETGMTEQMMPFGGGFSVVCDTSEYSWNAPYATAWICMAPENIGWHNWGVTLSSAGTSGRKALDKAADLLGVTACDLLLDEKIIEQAKSEMHERLEGKTYKCLLPDEMKPPVHLNEDNMRKYS